MIFRRLLGLLVGCIAWLYARTFRLITLHPENRPRQALFAIWHEHQMSAILTNPDPTMVTIASRSKDGDIIAAALRVFGLPVARGSSSRGGAAALKQLHEWVTKGHSVAITVDGPRGPRHGVKPGIVALAKDSLQAVVPSAIVAERAWRARSWDKFMIPKPFTRIVQLFGPAIVVRPEDDLTAKQAEIAAALVALNAEGEAVLRELTS